MYVSMYVNVQLLDVSSEGGRGEGDVSCPKREDTDGGELYRLQPWKQPWFCLGRVVEGGNLEKGINRPTIYTLPG